MKSDKITLSQLESFLMGAADILRGKMDELALKLELKRLGGDDFKAESLDLIRQHEPGFESPVRLGDANGLFTTAMATIIVANSSSRH